MLCTCMIAPLSISIRSRRTASLLIDHPWHSGALSGQHGSKSNRISFNREVLFQTFTPHLRRPGRGMQSRDQEGRWRSAARTVGRHAGAAGISGCCGAMRATPCGAGGCRVRFRSEPSAHSATLWRTKHYSGTTSPGCSARNSAQPVPQKTYGQRAKVETTFSVVKRKLSSRAPGRSPSSQIRQALLLGLAYNLYRLRRPPDTEEVNKATLSPFRMTLMKNRGGGPVIVN